MGNTHNGRCPNEECYWNEAPQPHCPFGCYWDIFDACQRVDDYFTESEPEEDEEDFFLDDDDYSDCDNDDDYDEDYGDCDNVDEYVDSDLYMERRRRYNEQMIEEGWPVLDDDDF